MRHFIRGIWFDAARFAWILNCSFVLNFFSWSEFHNHLPLWPSRFCHAPLRVFINYPSVNHFSSTFIEFLGKRLSNPIYGAGVTSCAWHGANGCSHFTVNQMYFANQPTTNMFILFSSTWSFQEVQSLILVSDFKKKIALCCWFMGDCAVFIKLQSTQPGQLYQPKSKQHRLTLLHS